MNAQELKGYAKAKMRVVIQTTKGGDLDELVDAIIEAAVKAAVVEITEKYKVDVPNTGYFGEIVRR